MFSDNANEVNLLDGNGWTLSFTFRTDSNVDDSDVIVSMGKYSEQTLTAGIEIRANKVIYAVSTT
jgi:flagellar hook-basal body complex protein FliE